jgi:hypothetical protein
VPVPDRLSSRIVLSAGAAALVLLLAGCGSPPEPVAAPAPATVVGTVVRFTSPNTSVDVTIGEDSPATRDFLSMLPLTIRLEEFAGREKIGDLPRELSHRGTPGSDPKDGDLIYFTPWGNLGFYYDTSGVGHSDQTLHIGTYDASREQLAQLQGDGVTVQIVERS